MTTKTQPSPSRDTTTRINRDTMQRIRIIAAKRGIGPGVLINRILASRAALTAALAVLDEEEKAVLYGDG